MSQNAQQTVRVAKEFHWEMGHRLPFHTGGCQNIHGHSYRLWVEVEGTTDQNGMVMDYFDLKQMIEPIIARIDHSFLCDERDDLMRGFLGQTALKHTVVPFNTTAENLAAWLLDLIAEQLHPLANITGVTVRLHETERTYAERRRQIQPVNQ
ncbi:MAG: 6-pyruvoyl tetrahydrobiopterin synthase [Chlorobi bacterium OLB7]|nr:MAG: 6-pyruvoyl tetrahydrobiopterin synthase [Chlorobi bacterium OLB7]